MSTLNPPAKNRLAARLSLQAAPTLAGYAERRDNNFNLIRLLAAAIVILSHSYAVTLHGGAEPLMRASGLDLGALAVNVFFVISGFLVTKSFLRRRSLGQFIAARVLRIWPGLLVAVLSNVLLFGAAFTTLPLKEYLTARATWEYFGVNAALLAEGVNLRFLLPGVFAANPWGAAVNGSLWTLPYEVWIYVGLTLVGLAGLLRRRWAVNALLLLILGLATALAQGRLPGPLFAHPALPFFLRFASFFGWGAVFYVNRSVIPLHGGIAAALAGLTILAWRVPTTLTLLFPLALTYGVFWLGYAPGGFIRRYNRLGDTSYGVYIYAFPVQQSLVALLPGIDPLPLAALALPVTLVFAILSWRFVEHPALRLKQRFAGRAPRPVAVRPHR